MSRKMYTIIGPRGQEIMDAALKLNATPATIPGMWNVPGYLAALTTVQLLQIAAHPFPASGQSGLLDSQNSDGAGRD